MNQHLHGQASRSRTRFIKIIADRSKEIEEERVEIAKENSKNEKGEVVFIDKAGKVVKENTPDGRYDVKDMNKFIKEWRDYLNEDYLIDVTPANRDIINGVKIILLTTNDEFKGDGAIMYNEWCESFENITDKVEVKKEKKNDK